MVELAVAAARSESTLKPPSDRDLLWIPGGTFRMGSDKHYQEEAPVHRVTVDGFWIDRTPVTTDWWSTRHEADAPKACCIPENPRGRARGRELRPLPAQHPDSAQGAEGRLASLRAELLPPLPPGRAPRGSGRYVHDASRIPLCDQKRKNVVVPSLPTHVTRSGSPVPRLRRQP